MPAVFQSGVKVEMEGTIWRLNRQLTDSTWQLENERTGRIREMTRLEILSAYVNSKLTFVIAQGALEGKKNGKVSPAVRWLIPAETEIAKTRRSYVNAVIKDSGSKKHIKGVIRAVWEKLKAPEQCPDYVTVIRWRKRYLAHGKDIVALVPCERSGNSTARLPDDLATMIRSTVDAVYLTRERKTIADTLHAAINSATRENELRAPVERLPMPTRRQIETVVYSIPAYDRVLARYGKNAANARFRAAMGGKILQRPLQRAEVDHTKLDVFVIDDKTGLPLGRPWVTACIDAYTRCVLGLHVGFSPPSYHTVAKCLSHAVLPKIDQQELVPELKGEWLAYGVMDTLVVDNGMEFHSEALEQACYMLNIEIEYCPRRVPWFKGTVERFLGSLNRGVAHGIPGTTFSKIFDKGDYDPAKHAVIRLGTLRKMLMVWVVDYYHQRPHRILKASPNSVWTSSIKEDDIPLPPDPARLHAILGRPVERKLTHKGIEYAGLQYNSVELREYRYRVGEAGDVDIRIDDDNLGEIIVLGKDGQLIRVEALDQNYAAGLTSWQHELCKVHAAKSDATEHGTPAWIKAKAAIAEIVANEIKNGKKLKRGNARIGRYREETRGQSASSPKGAGNGEQPALPPPPPTPPAAGGKLRPPAAPRKFVPIVKQRAPSADSREAP